MTNLPALETKAALVYVRASKDGTFPTSPHDFVRGLTGPLVLQDLSDLSFQANLPAGPTPIAAAIQIAQARGWHKVYTVHSRSMLGRLFRWHACRIGEPPIPYLQPPQLVDIVDQVNEPAVLSMSSRYEFSIQLYEQTLGLTTTMTDRETGLLINMVRRYCR